ncbi:MAG: hypothetical protein CXZ00_05685 [Acidobacteria bacterium]|nr:MAG: hypothetical protein CXZ00_05685 [Acidobacteriota bacterium]
MYARQHFRKVAARLVIAAMLASLNVGVAQQTPQDTSQAPAQTKPPSQPSGVMIDPSKGPLKPNEPSPASTTSLPEAPQPQPAPAEQSQTSRQPQPPQEPLGVAAAEQVKTAGGGASRPAGNAIAPAKQRQYRSLLIKLGAVAAGAIAVGSVYGLSRGTSARPSPSAAAARK